MVLQLFTEATDPTRAAIITEFRSIIKSYPAKTLVPIYGKIISYLQDNNTNNLDGFFLQRVDFSAKNLSQLSFVAADLQKADLSRADISSSNFSGADLRHTNLRDCKRKGAIFTGAVISADEIPIMLTTTEYNLFESLQTINSQSKTNEAKATTQAILQQIISHPQRDDINISLLTTCYSNSLLERLKKISPSPQKFIALIEIINDPSFISSPKNSDAENIIQHYKTELSASLNQVIQYLETKIQAKPSKSVTIKP